MSTGLPIGLEQEYKRNKKLREFFKKPENQLKFDADLPLKDRQTEFETHLDKFEVVLPKKDVSTKRITSAKQSLKEESAKLFASIVSGRFPMQRNTGRMI